MGSKVIVFDDTAPMGVEHAWAFLAWADAITPVVFVRKTPAGPTQLWNLQFLQRSQHVIAVAVGIGNRRIRSDPDSFVNAMAEVFGELTVDVFVDDRSAPRGVEHELGFSGFRNRGENDRSECG
ncbi:MAG: hypothetical protein BWY82_02081 [Verrucomicrobia bacterium ADurb.Bin474]|nr:MAG: hypothetical protein BWY82_02081 [Verrucomicrobia bacterium ADurb.Bin474]